MNMSAVGVAGATGVGQADAPLRLRGIEWPAFWQGVRGRLVQDGYRPNTLRV